jgi:parallel beta-helix repeat protein
MHRKILQVVTLIALVFLPLSTRAEAAAWIVGTCKAGVRFATIQAAVDAAPPGSTIQVCPGIYPEQVAIDKQLVLKGISSGTAGAAVITPPATGLVPNFTGGMYTTVAAQLLVHDTTGVSISNLTIDGAGAACPAPSGWAGIAYESYSGSITISNVAVRNGSSYPDCKGAAVLSELGNSLTLQNSSIHGFYYGVISSEGTAATISGNLIRDGLRGIYVIGTGLATISNNTILGIDFPQDAAIFVASLVNVIANNVTVSGNTVEGSTADGIAFESVTNSKVTGNKVIGFQFGLFLVDLTSTVVQTNVVRDSGTGIFLTEYDAAGGNTLTNNTVNEAACGLMLGNVIGSKVAPNSFFNVTATTCN